MNTSDKLVSQPSTPSDPTAASLNSSHKQKAQGKGTKAKAQKKTSEGIEDPGSSEISEEEEEEEKEPLHPSYDNDSFSDENDIFNPEDGLADFPGEDYEPPEVSLPPDQQPYGGLKVASDTESDEDFEVDSNEEEEDEDSEEEEQSEEEDPHSKRKKRKTPLKKKQATTFYSPAKLVMHVANTQYDVVRYVGKKKYKMRLTHFDQDDWDLQWIDTNMTPDKLAKMRPYQKINHYPGMYGLARKNHLGRNLMKMRRVFPQKYRFFPQTWLLPSEYNDFKAQFNRRKAKTFILKPEASSQGKGIFLTRNIDDIDPTDHLVAQRYLHRPYLIEGLKFDLRIYVLVFGCDPLRVYMFKEGLTRFATEPYQPPVQSNLKNLFMHLTNYAINKNSENFVFNQTASDDDIGHKRSLSFTWRYLREQGHDVDKLIKEIHAMIIKTLCSVQPMLAHVYRSCQPQDHANSMAFEILGFDVMIDKNVKPYLIEVNHSPSFTADTPLDKKIKKTLVSDTIRLCNFSLKAKSRWKNKHRVELQRRVLTGKKENITAEERDQLRLKKQQKRNQYELANLGNFTPIYLGEPHQEYDEYLKAAMKIWEDFTGAKKHGAITTKLTHSPSLQQSQSSLNMRRGTKQEPKSNIKARGQSEIQKNQSKVSLNKQKSNQKSHGTLNQKLITQYKQLHQQKLREEHHPLTEGNERKKTSQQSLPMLHSLEPSQYADSPMKQPNNGKSFFIPGSPQHSSRGIDPMSSPTLMKLQQEVAQGNYTLEKKGHLHQVGGYPRHWDQERHLYQVTNIPLEHNVSSGYATDQAVIRKKQTHARQNSLTPSDMEFSTSKSNNYNFYMGGRPDRKPALISHNPSLSHQMDRAPKYLLENQTNSYYKHNNQEIHSNTFYVMQQSIEKKYQEKISSLISGPTLPANSILQRIAQEVNQQ